MAESQLLLLADRHDVDHFGHVTDGSEHLVLAGTLQNTLQLKIVVEVILDHALVAVGHKDHILHSGANGFLHDVLNHRLVVDRQHLLGNILACRQRTRSPARHGNDHLANIHALLSSNVMSVKGFPQNAPRKAP